MIHVPNLMSIFLSLGRLSKDSVQVRSFVKCFVRKLFLRWGIVSPTPNPEAGGPPTSRLSAAAYSTYSQQSSIGGGCFFHPQPEDAPYCGDRGCFTGVKSIVMMPKPSLGIRLSVSVNGWAIEETIALITSAFPGILRLRQLEAARGTCCITHVAEKLTTRVHQRTDIQGPCYWIWCIRKSINSHRYLQNEEKHALTACDQLQKGSKYINVLRWVNIYCILWYKRIAFCKVTK
jgi:hypothetical protein